MSAAPGSVSRPTWNTIAASASDAWSARGIQRGDADQVPHRVDGRPVLLVLGQPVAEAACVDGRVGAVEPAQRECGPDEAQPLRGVQQRIAQQRTAEVQRSRQAVAAQPGLSGQAGRPDRNVEPVLQRHLVRDTEPVQQRLVGRAAAQEHVLAVVDVEITAPKRVGQTAELRPSLVERDLRAGVRHAQRRGDAGQAAADDRDAGHVDASADEATGALAA